MRFRAALSLSILAGALALFAVACGGGGKKSADASNGGGSVPAGADYVLSSATAFISANTDFDGAQWSALDDLSAKFPDREKALELIRAELSKRGISWDEIKAALGPETDVGAVGEDAGVIVTQSPDEAKTRTLAQKLADEGETWIVKKVGDWVAASDKQSSVDSAARAHAGSSLADSAAFKEAMGDLPADALLRLWVPGSALAAIGQSVGVAANAKPSVPGLGKLQWLAAAVQAKDAGVRLAFSVKSSAATSTAFAPYASELVDEVPSGVLAYLSFRDVGRALTDAARQYPEIVAQVEEQLGVTVAELAPLLGGEGALYARPGAPLPEVTIVLQVDDERAAVATADKLVPKLAEALGATGVPETSVVEGVTLKVLRGENFPVVWGAFDGKLVISNSTTSVTGLKGGDKLKDDSLFEEARDSAEMPDETSGFLYLNLKDIVPLIRNFADAASADLPPEVLANLEPLRSFLVFATRDGATTRATGFLGLD